MSRRPTSSHKFDIDLVWQASESLVRGCVFISDLETARNISHLKKLNIQAVITVARGAFLPHPESDLPNYMYLPADDRQDFNITGYFEKTYGFIDKQLHRTNVLVHCAAGISRSACIVIAYLMRRLKQGFVNVFSNIRARRPEINPNSGFVVQLKQFEQKLRYEETLTVTPTAQQNLRDSRAFKQKSETSENTPVPIPCGLSQSRKYPSTATTAYSTQLLDSNIERLKNRCLKLEIASKRSRSLKRRPEPSTPCDGSRRMSVPSFKPVTLEKPGPQRPQLNLFSVEVPQFNLGEHRSKTSETKQLASYIAQLN